MRTPVARPAPIPRRAAAALLDLAAISLGVMLLWWLGVGRLDWPHGPYDWIDELGTLAGQEMARLGPPLLAFLSVSLVWRLGGRLAGAGATPGERIVGLRMLDGVGQDPHPLRQVARVALGLVTAWPIGWWYCLLHAGRQTIADRLSGMRLVHRRGGPDSL